MQPVEPGEFARVLLAVPDRLDMTIDSCEIIEGGGVTTIWAEATFTSRRTGRRLSTSVAKVYRLNDGRRGELSIHCADTSALLALADETTTAAPRP